MKITENPGRVTHEIKYSDLKPELLQQVYVSLEGAKTPEEIDNTVIVTIGYNFDTVINNDKFKDIIGHSEMVSEFDDRLDEDDADEVYSNIFDGIE